MKISNIEKAILSYIAERNPDPHLAEQIAILEVDSREHTGVGLYTNFSFPTRNPTKQIPSPQSPYSGPNFSASELEYGAGAVLWCGDDGFLSCIEIFSYSDEYPIEDFEFELMPDEPYLTLQAEQAVAPNRSLAPTLKSTSSVRGSED